ncbi:MAG: PGF-CTERM sorting domain-containing protein, partial [archaeon]|nr:PGF-CTERM sorting domain-containing protein [archaeon]
LYYLSIVMNLAHLFCDAPKGSYTLSYISPFEEGNVSFNVAMPKFVVTSVPANMTFNLGENVTMTFGVKNIGTAEDQATMRLEVLGIHEDVNFTWIKPGEEANISFDFIMPDDLEEKSYKALYEVNGEKGKFSFFAQGANITVDASLDKTLYEENETAVLSLNVRNNRNMNLSLFSRVKFNEYENVTHFNLTGLESKILTFNVPVKFGGDNKMLYTVYTDSGRALYINSIYIYEKKPGVPIRLYTDKDVYNMGEVVTIHIIDVTRTDLLSITAPNLTYNDTISGPTTLTFTLPELRSGTYYIEYTFGNFSSAHPFDVIGYSSRVIEADLGKEKYYSGEAVRLGINIEANRDVSGLLRTWIYNPDDELIDEFETNKTLTEGENEIEISRTLLTNKSGIHTVVYGFYADLRGHSLTLLASGAEYFDAEAVDTTPPIITFVDPTPANNSEVTVDYVFVNVTLDEMGRVALLTWNGMNYTMSVSGMNFYKNMTGLSNGNYTYKAYANDTSGNMGKSETRAVKVNVPAPTPTPSPTPTPTPVYPRGGGGAAPVALPPGVTTIPTDPTGEVTSTVTATSADGKASVTIPAGTIARDAAGNPLAEVSLTLPSALPASVPVGTEYVGIAIQLGPSGATFSQPVEISITFDPAKFEGKIPVIYVYEAGAWKALETTIVDCGALPHDPASPVRACKAIAKVDHFSAFALLAVSVAPTPTPVVTPTPTITPTPAPIPTPTPTPKPWWKIPGFEAVFAILGLLAVAYLLRRRRK